MKWDEERQAELRELVEVQGLTSFQVADIFKVGRGAITGACQRWGITFKRHAGFKEKGGPPRTKRKPGLASVSAANGETLEYVEPYFPFRECQWIDGDVGEPSFCRCTKSRVRGAYCEPHAQRAYRMPWERR